MRLLPAPLRSRARATRACLAALGGAALAACASRGASAPIADQGVAPSMMRVEGAGATELAAASTPLAATETRVQAPVDRTWAALAPVYESLGIQVNTVVTETRTFGVREGRVTRRLGKQQLSRYLECGNDIAQGANADSYLVSLTVLSRVTPATAPAAAPGSSSAASASVADAGASLLVTQVFASARPLATSGNPVRCGSTGRLEQAINSGVRARIGA